MMTVVASANHLRVSPRKVALVADALTGLKATEALEALKFVDKSAAKDLTKVIKSALSNATNNNKLEEKDLYISQIVTMEGPRLKRFRARSRGMAHRIIKKTAHIKVVLEEKKSSKEVK
jgi:large subunit ribosomal protein L22